MPTITAIHTKTANCYSCAGGLRFTQLEGLYTCDYCGNTNYIFSDLRTEIRNLPKKFPRTVRKSKPIELTWKQKILAGIIILFAGGIALSIYKSHKQQQQKTPPEYQ